MDPYCSGHGKSCGLAGKDDADGCDVSYSDAIVFNEASHQLDRHLVEPGARVVFFFRRQNRVVVAETRDERILVDIGTAEKRFDKTEFAFERRRRFPGVGLREIRACHAVSSVESVVMLNGARIAIRDIIAVSSGVGNRRCSLRRVEVENLRCPVRRGAARAGWHCRPSRCVERPRPCERTSPSCRSPRCMASRESRSRITRWRSPSGKPIGCHHDARVDLGLEYRAPYAAERAHHLAVGKDSVEVRSSCTVVRSGWSGRCKQ